MPPVPFRRTRILSRGLAAALLACSLVLSLGACSSGSWFGSKEDSPLPGERISVLELQRSLEPEDIATEAQGFIAPAAWKNEFWPQTGGYPNHSMQHLALRNAPLERAWKANIGDGANKSMPLTAPPIVVDGKVFTLDRKQNLTAFNAADGRQIWRINIRKKNEKDLVIGGGIAYSRGRLYVTNGYNELICLDPEKGGEIWRIRLPAPARAAPTVVENRVFTVTLDNKLYAHSSETGEYLWEYSGVTETTGLVGAASPAATRNLVLPAFSSGEIYALQAENGVMAWSENLSGSRYTGGLASISDIRGLPVIDKSLVFAVSFGGRMVAIDERTGNRVWQREIGSSETPWVAGNTIFLVTTNNELVALSRESGAIRWVISLPRFRDPGNRTGPITWTGPVLAGGRLILASSGGMIAEIEPDTGNVIREWKADGTFTLPLVVAGETLYLLSTDGTLLAYR